MAHGISQPIVQPKFRNERTSVSRIETSDVDPLSKTTSEKLIDVSLKSLEYGLLIATPLLLMGCGGSEQMKLYTANQQDQKVGLDYDKLDGRITSVTRGIYVAHNIRTALASLERATENPQKLADYIRSNPTEMQSIARKLTELTTEFETVKADPNLGGMKYFGLGNKIKNIPSEIQTATSELNSSDRSSPLNASQTKALSLLAIDVKSALFSSALIKGNLSQDKTVLERANAKHKRNIENFKKNAATIEANDELAEKLDPILELLDKAAEPKNDFAYFSARPAEKVAMMNELYNAEMLFRGLSKNDKYDYFLNKSPSQIASDLSEIRESLRDPSKFEKEWKWTGWGNYDPNNSDWRIKDMAWYAFQAVQTIQTRLDDESKRLREGN